MKVEKIRELTGIYPWLGELDLTIRLKALETIQTLLSELEKEKEKVAGFYNLNAELAEAKQKAEERVRVNVCYHCYHISKRKEGGEER